MIINWTDRNYLCVNFIIDYTYGYVVISSGIEINLDSNSVNNVNVKSRATATINISTSLAARISKKSSIVK